MSFPELVRRNIQKSIALDALVVELRGLRCNLAGENVCSLCRFLAEACQYGSIILAERLVILRMAPAGSKRVLGLNWIISNSGACRGVREP